MILVIMVMMRISDDTNGRDENRGDDSTGS